MRLLEPAELGSLVAVLPAIAHLPRLGRPAIHPPRAGDDGVGVARAKVEGALSTDEGIDQIDIARGAGIARLEGEATAEKQAERKVSE